MKKLYTILAAIVLSTGMANAQNLTDTADFENLILEANSYWNGSDQSGGFSSGGFNFPNNYNPDWQTWSQWVYSNMADDTTAGYTNPASAITAAGYDTTASNGNNYAVCNVPIDFISSETLPVPLYFEDGNKHAVEGFYVTNSTYAALSMENGDAIAKKFGGESGDDPDWFRLSIFGYSSGVSTDTVAFYLADYRFEDNSQDYIVKDWEWVDLSSLEMVDSLMFVLHSSDVGQYGMNTPAYFCADNLVMIKSAAGIEQEAAGRLNVYPNPTAGKFIIENKDNNKVNIYDMDGSEIYESKNYSGQYIDLSKNPAGVYFIHVKSNSRNFTGKIIKN